MKFVNKVFADPNVYDEFFNALDPEAPLVMINLLKFKEKAKYPDERETQLSGAEAYKIYGEAVEKLIEGLGGKLLHAGRVTGILMGEIDELWDTVGIVEYPTPGAFRGMLESEEYKQAHLHREAGLSGQLNIATTSPGHVRNS